ncbi:RNA polymerase sigma factor [Deinococcus metalli]|uniref:RNA polymerase sigma factor SigM n=1 Tax=Deinococcus metalli TaxID=1141878 RepID=A0ABQ3JUS1_9DEIO|nr:RNA polymerase sigma factor SigM [Deinococcus metalli]
MTLDDPHTTLPDHQLLRLAPRDERAFEALVTRHAPAVHRLAAVTVGPGAADDVVQEVFVALHRSVKTFRGDAQLSTWLHRVTLNACYRALKTRKTVPLEDAPEPAAPHDPVQAGEQSDLRERLRRALDTLPPEQREAVTLREIAGLEYAQIAELTGVELGTVKSRINRGRAALREWLTRAGVRP